MPTKTASKIERGMKHTKLQSRVVALEEKVFGEIRD